MSAKSKQAMRGMAILEIILAVATVGVMISYYLKISDKQFNEQKGRIEAENEALFQQLAQQYFTTNRTAMISAMGSATASADVTSHCAVSVTNTAAAVAPGTTPGSAGTNGTLSWSATKKTCAFDTTFLRAKGIWPLDALEFQDPEMGGAWRYVAIFRRVPGDLAVLTENVEMLIARMDVDGALPSGLTRDTWANDDARKQRNEAARGVRGFTGGAMPIGDVGWCKTTKTNTQACGNGWKADLANFLDGTQLQALRDKLPN